VPSRDWPFADPENVATFTVADVLSGAKPVLYICHDVADGGWQFLTGEDVDPRDVRLVCLKELIDRDETLTAVADLPLGWCAERTSPADEWVRAPRYPMEWDALVEEAYRYTEQQQERLTTEFAISSYERWDWEQSTATLTFSTGGVRRAAARFQMVGSVSTVSNTWLWSWANASLLDSAREGVHLLREFGLQNGFEKLTDATWPADEVDGWEMATVACLLLDGEGVYRAPSDTGFMFLVLNDPRLVQ
jgi:hypothetical protein